MVWMMKYSLDDGMHTSRYSSLFFLFLGAVNARLCKWLRLVGVDVTLYGDPLRQPLHEPLHSAVMGPSTDARQLPGIVAQASREGRMVLTMDRKIAANRRLKEVCFTSNLSK
jgi:uncharacterized protein with PIN domain